MAKHDLDKLFEALSDPTRRQIVERLARGPATVSELAAPHDMALPSFLGHIRKLEDSGVIETTKTGRVRTCSLKQGAILPAEDWLQRQRRLWADRLDRLDTYAAALHKARQDDP